jgi:hypothetical protein
VRLVVEVDPSAGLAVVDVDGGGEFALAPRRQRLLGDRLLTGAVGGGRLQHPRLGDLPLAEVAADRAVHRLEFAQHVQVGLVGDDEGFLAAILRR